MSTSPSAKSVIFCNRALFSVTACYGHSILGPVDKPRILVWVSWGAASVVAARETLVDWQDTHEVLLLNCDTRSSEHADNYRFAEDVQNWLGVPITFLKSSKFKDIDQVFEETRYMSGTGGARCTTEVKKIPRLEFSRADDRHVFGYTAEEKKRIADFHLHNPDLRTLFILAGKGITKQDCYDRIAAAGLRLPTMYALGFDNNNCPGCVKAASPWYWDMIRTHFPEVFTRRCKQSRELGVRLVECSADVMSKLAPGVVPIGKNRRIFLDELPPGPFKKWRGKKAENLSCGPECGATKP